MLPKSMARRPRKPLAEKWRADRWLVEHGLASTRSQAAALLMSGRVFQGEQRIDKAGWLVQKEAELRVEESPRYASRGGIKLEGALRALTLSVEDSCVVDLGASTGGFCDCLLQHGARRVYAVDVGRGQLAPKLAEDSRVVVRDQTNARRLTKEDFPEPIDLITVDVSFISITKLLGAVVSILAPGGRLLAMVKPQFEAGRREAQRAKGVISDETVRDSALSTVRAGLGEHGLAIIGECDCELRGKKGNLERFILAARRGDQQADTL